MKTKISASPPWVAKFMPITLVFIICISSGINFRVGFIGTAWGIIMGFADVYINNLMIFTDRETQFKTHILIRKCSTLAIVAIVYWLLKTIIGYWWIPNLDEVILTLAIAVCINRWQITLDGPSIHVLHFYLGAISFFVVSYIANHPHTTMQMVIGTAIVMCWVILEFLWFTGFFETYVRFGWRYFVCDKDTAEDTHVREEFN